MSLLANDKHYVLKLVEKAQASLPENHQEF